MDGDRFDRLARELAKGSTSRRGFLARAVAALTAGAGLSIVPAGAEARQCRSAGLQCLQDETCCSGVCLPPDRTGRRRCAKPAGATCASGTECASGSCVDGVCCDTSCTGQCESCVLAGQVGTCTPVTGAPPAGKPACAGSGACSGACDGVHGETCAYPGEAITCGSPTCSNSDARINVCDGAGSCQAKTTDCGLYACSGGACKTTCANDGDCLGAAYCDAGVCREDRPTGAACSQAGQCLSGFCVDGVCCATACNGQCQTCDASGQCQTVSGQPTGGRAACGGAGTVCAGSCPGNSANCVYPVGLDCAADVCDGAGNTFTTYACAAGGTCAGSVAQCGAYRCNAAAGGCLSACGNDDDCSAGYHCTVASGSGGACVANLADGSACGRAGECASGTCTAGICGFTLLPFGSGCTASNQCLSNNCSGGVCSCSFVERLCNGVCIPIDACCDDNDCGFDIVCQRPICNQQTRMCDAAPVNSHPRCVSDHCTTRYCDAGICVQEPVPSPCVATFCETTGTCDPATGWQCGELICDNPPGRCDYGIGTCYPGVGCIYPQRC